MSSIDLVKARALRQLEELIPASEQTEDVLLAVKALETLKATTTGDSEEGSVDLTDVYNRIDKNATLIDKLGLKSDKAVKDILGLEDDVYSNEMSILRNARTLDTQKLTMESLQSGLDDKLGREENALSASRWYRPCSVSFVGDVSGELVLDGSASVAVNTRLDKAVDAASVNGYQADCFVNNEEGHCLVKPKGCEWRELGNQLGPIILNLPTTNNQLTADFIFKFSFFQMEDNASFELFLACTLREGQWYGGVSATQIGGSHYYTVRLCQKEQVYPYIAIGLDTEGWIAPSATVTEILIAGADNEASRWRDGWQLTTPVDTLPALEVKRTVVAQRPVAGSGAGGADPSDLAVIDELASQDYGLASSAMVKTLETQTVTELSAKLGRNDTAEQAKKLETARKISFTGGLVGEVAFDGSEDVSLEVLHSTGSGGLSVSDAGGENSYNFQVDEQGNLDLTSSSGIVNTAMTPNGDMIIAGDYCIESDERHKENFEKLSCPLTDLKKVSGYKYSLKSTGQKTYGLKAQDIKELFPELVGVNKKGLFYVNYTGLIPILIEAMKAMHDSHVRLLRRVNALEKKVEKS